MHYPDYGYVFTCKPLKLYPLNTQLIVCQLHLNTAVKIPRQTGKLEMAMWLDPRTQQLGTNPPGLRKNQVRGLWSRVGAEVEGGASLAAHL